MRADSENLDPQATVFVVDDDAAVRDSLRWLLESMHLKVQTFDSAEAFLAVARADARGCMVLDVQMPGMSGPALFEECKRRHITLPTLFLSGHGEVPVVVDAIKGGAVNYLLKPCNNPQLLESVQAALEADETSRGVRQREKLLGQRLDGLTTREREILEQVVAGRSNKEVGRTLGISYKTVEAHRGRLMRKMGAASFAELLQMMLTRA
ncbi:response regulator [Nevskia sp.]|uniref:response regulator transcription factor n=1 Tax=Nevskia sp. TaxID=1929292 RepID=UPI0025EBF92A|nr:response regulator [Nevskia sp.]